MSAAVTEVYRSSSRSDCEERSFVLAAVGIASVIGHDVFDFFLQVEVADAFRALEQLQDYAAESRPTPVPPMPPVLYANAWVGCVVYAAVLLGAAFMISNGLGPLDAFQRGELDAARVQAGQWWRAWTAQTLHLDAAHLVGNLGAGCWFGYLAARQIGSGNAWFLLITGAALANLFEAQFGPSTHLAVGASTAVFTALGLLAAHSWRTRFHLSQRWAIRWGPLVAGAVLLGWLGSAGEGTDLVAHAIGFLIGGLLGATVALPAVIRALNRVPQWLAGLAALASIAIAWACALVR